MVMIEKSECVMRTHPMVRNDIRSWNCNGTRFFSCATTSNNNKRPSIVDVKEKGATINSSSSQLLKMYVIVIASVQFTRTMPIKVKLRAKSDTIWHMFWIDKFFRFLRKIYCNTILWLVVFVTSTWLFGLDRFHIIHGSLLIGSILLSPPTIQFRNFPPLLTAILSCNGNMQWHLVVSTEPYESCTHPK